MALFAGMAVISVISMQNIQLGLGECLSLLQGQCLTNTVQTKGSPCRQIRTSSSEWGVRPTFIDT
jgi:hypothetical protein